MISSGMRWNRAGGGPHAGARVFAYSEGDRWSDLDLTFGVSDDVSMFDVLEDWTRDIVKEFGAIQLFNLLSKALL